MGRKKINMIGILFQERM